MSRIQTQEQDGYWVTWVKDMDDVLPTAQGKTEQEAVGALAWRSSVANMILHKEQDYWLERWMPKTEEEQIALFKRAFGVV